MIHDWFSPLELPISFSDFVRLPRHPAYKYEYFGGRAVLSPRPRYRQAAADLTVLAPANSAPTNLAPDAIRPLRPDDWAHLPELFAAAFQNVPPISGLSGDVRVRVAEECLEYTRQGGDGRVLEPACFVAADPRRPTRIEGAILVTLILSEEADAPDGPVRPHLTWIMVAPLCFGRGLGSALLANAAAVLRGLGHRELTSTFLVGNERSALWHWRNGFRLLSPTAPPATAFP